MEKAKIESCYGGFYIAEVFDKDNKRHYYPKVMISNEKMDEDRTLELIDDTGKVVGSFPKDGHRRYSIRPYVWRQ